MIIGIDIGSRLKTAALKDGRLIEQQDKSADTAG